MVDPAGAPPHPARDAWITVAFTYEGLKALGVPQESLDSFAPEFRQGMAARAAELGDVGESSPEHWEKPLGTPTSTSHWRPVARCGGAGNVLERARRAHHELAGVELIWRQDCYQLPTGRTSFGFKDGIGQPTVEGSGTTALIRRSDGSRQGSSSRLSRRDGRAAADADPRSARSERHIHRFPKAADARGGLPSVPPSKGANREEVALLAAKMVGRWQSGAPLALSPERDDPGVGADPEGITISATPTISAASSARRRTRAPSQSARCVRR